MPGARTVLTSDWFVGGYQRLWMNPSHAQIIAYLYEFATPTGASDYFRYGLREIHATSSRTTQFAVPGLPRSHSIGIAEEAADHRGVEMAMAVTGRLLMEVACTAEAATGLKARLLPLARQQFDRL